MTPIYIQRTFPHSIARQLPGKRFIIAGFGAAAMLVVLVVLAVTDMAHGQAQDGKAVGSGADAKVTTPAKAPVPAPVPAPAPAPVAPTAPTGLAANVDACTQCKGQYCPSVLQCKDLSLTQKDAVIAIQAYNTRLTREQLTWDEYKRKEEAIQGMVNQCRKVMEDNKWPAKVLCTPNTSPVGFVEDTAGAAAGVGAAPAVAVPAAVAPAPVPAPVAKPVKGVHKGK